MKLRTYLISIPLLLISGGCEKYLDAKSDQSLVVISSLEDLQSLLDNRSINITTASSDAVSADEYYLSNTTYQALGFEQQRNMYTWQSENLFRPYTSMTNDWTQTYNNVYIANTVIDHMNKVERTALNAISWDNIKGQALFLRAYSFYKAVSIWALSFDEHTADADLGIPLRLNSDFNEPSTRSSIAQTYDQIISDTKDAVRLLPAASLHVYRSGKPAGYALLARVNLSMRRYNLAGLYADSCLQLSPALLDYNNINTAAAYPINEFNVEVIYDSASGGQDSAPISASRAKIETWLYGSYDGNDLRKTAYFSPNSDGSMFFKGSYEGNSNRFNGLATDEMYLIRSESYIRQGNISAGMADLNTLLKNRYATGTFTDISINDPSEALSKIILERTKELVMRGTRWTDIKRLNKEGADINLKRVLDDQVYTLPADDLRFALPLPDDIISLSGMPQNPR